MAFVLQLSTGHVVTLTGNVLIGRGPVAQPGERFDELIRVVDPAKLVSKTHLAMGVDEDLLWVGDRYSANGTVLRRADGTAERCTPGRRHRVDRGDRVEFGDHFLLVS